MLSLRGLHDQAKIPLEKAREIEPTNARVLLGLAAVYRDAGDVSTARIAFEEAGELDPALALRFPLFDSAADPPVNQAEFSGRAGADALLLSVDWVDE